MFTKRVKSKPANRSQRLGGDDDEEGGGTATDASMTATADDSPSTLATKLKDRAKKSRPKSRLSFGGADDEEGTDSVFQVKKSRLSQKLTLGQSSKHSQDALPNLETLSVASHRPTYDAAHLNELKANTRKAPPPEPSDPYDADMSMDMSMDAGDVTMSLVDDEEIPTSFIPSESSIKVAKERRERSRASTSNGEPDFISLSLTRQTENIGPHPESRLVREDDEMGEGDDEYAEYTSAQERIALGKKSRKVEAKKRRDAMVELIADAEEEDEEADEWENEQLRRGGHSKLLSETSQTKQVYKAAPIPAATNIPTLSSAVDRLALQLSQLTTSHATNTSTMNSLSVERDDVGRRETEMRDMVVRAEEKRAWFSSFDDWIEGVAGFLDEKYPLLEKLEDEFISLLQERHEIVRKRRFEDDKDDLSLFFGTSPALQPREEKDEYGRSLPTEPELKAQRRMERIARRQLRKSQRDADEGFSTDSELPPPDENAYLEALEALETRRKDVLSDVKAKEFLDPSKGMWNTWREKYMDSYVGAWGGLGVVSVWEFWARLECVGWDCVKISKSLDTFSWYKSLYEYSRPDGEELGTDGDLVASMITTAIIPRICKVLEGGALDVYSEAHIKRLVDLWEEVEASVEQGNVKVQMLYKTIHELFKKAISESDELQREQLLNQSAMSFNPEAIPARQRYLNRRVKLLRNMVRWRKATGEKFGIGQSMTGLVDAVMLPVANSGWEVGGEDVMRKVLGLLPPELVPVALKNRLEGR